ncbi:hypothetical protein EV363DRAFT_1292130 [Boletus edulis]|nr:hypothetical protein EV363DRAFT_1292130 [Boletus edulis]
MSKLEQGVCQDSQAGDEVKKKWEHTSPSDHYHIGELSQSPVDLMVWLGSHLEDRAMKDFMDLISLSYEPCLKLLSSSWTSSLMKMVEVVKLKLDRWNWLEWHENTRKIADIHPQTHCQAFLTLRCQTVRKKLNSQKDKKSASSSLDDGKGTEVRRTSVKPQNHEVASQQVHKETTEVANSNTRCAKPTRPVGISHDPPDEPLKEQAWDKVDEIDEMGGRTDSGSTATEDHCTATVQPQTPQTTNQRVHKETADAENPYATCAEPMTPADKSHDP